MLISYSTRAVNVTVKSNKKLCIHFFFLNIYRNVIKSLGTDFTSSVSSINDDFFFLHFSSGVIFMGGDEPSQYNDGVRRPGVRNKS